MRNERRKRRKGDGREVGRTWEEESYGRERTRNVDEHSEIIVIL